MSSYKASHPRSLAERNSFWAEQPRLVDWHAPPEQVRDYTSMAIEDPGSLDYLRRQL